MKFLMCSLANNLNEVMMMTKLMTVSVFASYKYQNQ